MTYISLLRKKVFGIVLIIVISFLLYPQVVHSEVFNVTNEDELRAALSASESNSEDGAINIAAGLYNTNGEPFTYKSDEDFSLTIEGEGAGITILDGGSQSEVLKIEDNSGDFQFTIMSLTIQNGLNKDNDGDFTETENGGGILILGAHLVTIEDCEFVNNISERGGGGALFISGEDLLPANLPADVIVSRNIFRNNSASDDGGGALIIGAMLTLNSNNFLSNSTQNLDGGGASLSGGTLSISNNNFNSNIAKSRGGGLIANGNSLQISDNVFTENMSAEGGGASSTGSSVSVLDNEFSGNIANVGGGFYGAGSPLTIMGNQFQGNSANTGREV